MMKKLLTLAVMVILAGVLAGCGGGGELDENLFGRWLWDLNGDFTYTLEADGTGIRGFASEGMETFRWHVSGDRLTINRDTRDEYYRQERWLYTIDNGVLTMASLQEEGEAYHYYFDSQQQDTALTGTWAYDEAPDFTYTFNANGTGRRGYPGNIDNFAWSTTGTRLVIQSFEQMFYLEWEYWTYSIRDGVLTLESQQADGIVYRYYRLP